MKSQLHRRILLIDDDELSSQALVQRLERRGFYLVYTSRPKDAEGLITKEKIELVLLDIMMPEIDGLSLLKSLRSRFSQSDLPILMITSLADSQDVADAFQFGANDYLHKPINVDIATARILAHLSFVDLQKAWAQKVEIEAVQKLISTYNQELREPLGDALRSLAQIHKDLREPSPRLAEVYRSLQKMDEILLKIKNLNMADLSKDEITAPNSIMVQLKKLTDNS